MSLWEKYQENISYPKLETDKDVDILIIGGGISGLSTLYFLKNEENICLVESDRIGRGITKNTTGKITYLQGTIYSDLRNNINYETAKNYLESQQKAIKLIKNIIDKEKIDCDLEKVSSLVVANKNKDLKKLKAEKSFLEDENIKVEMTKFQGYDAIKVNDTYVFNPIKYLNGLKKVLKDKMILENTKIDSIKYYNDYYVCTSGNLKIKAKKVIIACHYPFFIFPFLLPLKSHIEKSYLMAWKVKENKKFSLITVSNPGFSLRFYQDKEDIYQIGLAKSHETAFKQDDEKNFKEMQKLFHLKDEEVLYKWSNVDIITDDKLNYVGEIKKNMFLITGFNTWGMTNSIISAHLISDLILNKNNKLEKLFSLKRINWAKIKSFGMNSLASGISFVGSKFCQKNWYKENIKFEKRNGKKVAIYIDEKGMEHVIYNQCPHMKCSLIFNEVEKTWDCPCHSSRFSIDGECIKGPSLSDISYKS